MGLICSKLNAVFHQSSSLITESKEIVSLLCEDICFIFGSLNNLHHIPIDYEANAIFHYNHYRLMETAWNPVCEPFRRFCGRGTGQRLVCEATRSKEVTYRC